MNFFQVILMALKSLNSNKVRAFLTMIGVILGVASVITLVSVMQGLTSYTMSSYHQMGANQLEANYYGEKQSEFEEAFEEFINKELSDKVEYTQAQIRSSGQIQYLDKVLSHSNLYYTDHNYIKLRDLDIKHGRNIAYGDIKSRSKVCVIGSFIRQEFFGGMSNPVGQTLVIAGEEYTVVGVLEEKYGGHEYSEDNVVLAPLNSYIYEDGNRGEKNYTIIALDSDYTFEIEDAFNNDFSRYFNDTNNFWVYQNKEWQDQMAEQERMLTLIVAAIGGITLLVGGVGIMNIMLVTVTERTREIGIRMSIGARRRNIISQFLIEAATVSALGGFLGILLGTLATMFFGSMILGSLLMPSVDIVIGSFFFSVGMGIFFGWYPAQKASKLNPIDALRTQ